MADTRLRFTWRLTFDGDPLMASEVEPGVRRILEFWTHHPNYPGKFVDLVIDGMAFGVMQVELTVIAHDQWRCRHRAAWISRALAAAARVSRVECTPTQDKLPPHEHRGERRFEAPKYQEVVSG